MTEKTTETGGEVSCDLKSKCQRKNAADKFLKWANAFTEVLSVKSERREAKATPSDQDHSSRGATHQTRKSLTIRRRERPGSTHPKDQASEGTRTLMTYREHSCRK